MAKREEWSEVPELIGVTRNSFAADIHAQKGLTCVSCHGGDASQDDAEVAMGRAAGFRAKPDRARIPQLCARCHSDGSFMRNYNPSLRTDQLSQYKTSVHGRRLEKLDVKVAVCTDCHGVHGILPAGDSRSSVHPLNVATTCSRCHADAAYMKGYSIPSDQFASYSASVHHKAMVERGDLSAPTCSTCHGNHGAAPPGVASVEFVCANCHVFQSQLFDVSPHKQAFAALDLPSCVTCHSNHRIGQPSDAMLGAGPQSVCTNCHAEGDAGFQAAKSIQERLLGLETAIHRAEEILGRAERSGMEVSEPLLELTQARDALTKARVTIHAFDVQRVEGDINPGLKTATAGVQAGEKALAELGFRRRGLGTSVVLVLIVLAGLYFYIREIERPGASPGSPDQN